MCKLYSEASRILEHCEQAGMQHLNECVMQSSFKKKQQLSMLAIKTRKNIDTIVSALTEANFLDKSSKRDERFWYKAVVFQEHSERLKDKRIQKMCPRYKEESKLKKIASECKTTHSSSPESSFAARESTNQKTTCHFMRKSWKVPRRIIIEELSEEGYRQVKLASKTDSSNLLSAMEALEPMEYIRDPILKYIFIFSPESQIKKSKLFTSGQFYSQDRASAMAAHVLSPPRESHVIDTCAAPGSKTTLIAGNLMKGTGQVFAVEKSHERFSTLESVVTAHELCNVEAVNSDFFFLRPDHASYSDVTHILVDVPCSGSGMASRQSSALSAERLASLQGLQAKLLRHALRFPAVHTVVYSTCSLSEEENEAVISDVMQSPEACDWVIEDLPRNLSSSRGNEDKYPGVGGKCLRFWPEKDFSNGFFICKFFRLKKDSPNEEDYI